MNLFTRWMNQKTPAVVRIIALVIAGGLFVGLIPWLLLVVLPRLDASWRLPALSFGLLNYILGGLLVLVGMFFAWWSILSQVLKAQGTPLPMLPTQSLLTGGPFKYCRNPMTFGTICAYLGVAVIAGSLASIGFVVLFFALLLLYVKLVEEKELALRFGQPYLDYKRVTPFLIPGNGRK